jgi:hypothetical protein
MLLKNPSGGTAFLSVASKRDIISTGTASKEIFQRRVLAKMFIGTRKMMSRATSIAKSHFKRTDSPLAKWNHDQTRIIKLVGSL